ncbi:MAG TPA: GatB/YqeY domain-containing protein [Candidatus Paceibacterota bacterium]|nr:GatB/YqeY domain-containing protein [Candidatus Paceibacterota bacterium]
MTIQEKIKEDIKSAMKARDEVRLSVLRGLSASFINELVTLKRTPQDKLSDEEALKVITRASKQRKDSIEQFEKGGRPELAESEKSELKIIEEFLPTLMSEQDIRAYVLAKKDEMGINSKEQFGQFMGAVMSGLKGKADGGLVKKIIEESL